MITFHPSAARLPSGKGYRPIVMLRKDKGRMVGSKSSATTYTTKDEARNHARNACHAAMANLHRDFPSFLARVA